MHIGNIKLENKVIAAPLAGITDKAFREICKQMGAGLVFTEMVSDKSLVYKNQRAYEILDTTGEKKPTAVQIFGSEVEFMTQAAVIVEAHGADIIDINMGCPTPKIVRNGEGAAMMLNLENARQVLRAVINAVKVPVTIKTRKGWDEKLEPTAVKLAQIAEEEGASAITIHGRTRSQFYMGQADWNIIREVKQAVKIPVIGNGDIFSPQDAKKMLEITGCDAVMVARGMLGNPWLLKKIASCIQNGVDIADPSLEERIRMAVDHLNRVCSLKGVTIGVKEMRKHIAWYLKGVRGAAKLRDEINKKSEKEEVEKLLWGILSDS